MAYNHGLNLKNSQIHGRREAGEALDAKRLLWKANIAGKEEEGMRKLPAEPDHGIAWTSRGGAVNAGVVTFHRISDAKSKIMLQRNTTRRSD